MEKFAVKGIDKDLKVYDNKIVLTEKRVRNWLYWLILISLAISTWGIGAIIFYFVWNGGNGKEKTIYTKNIKSIELKKPNSLTSGLIQFNLDDSSNWQNSYGSENSVAFNGTENYETCSAIRDYLEERVLATT